MTWTTPTTLPSTDPPSSSDPDAGTLRHLSFGMGEVGVPYVTEESTFPMEILNQDGTPVATVPQLLASDSNSRFNVTTPGSVPGLGDVVGPASATDNALVRFDLTTGKVIQNSTVTLSDTGVMVFPAAGTIQLGASPDIDHQLNIDGSMELEHTAAEADDHALEIIADAAGFGDVKAFDIDYISGAVATGQDEAIILINIDESLATGGDIVGLEVIGTEGSASMYGLFAGALVNPIIQLSGVFANAATVDNNGSVITTLDSGGAGNVAIFTSNSDYMIIGDGAKFEEIEYLLRTGASGAGIKPTFEFSTGVGTWDTFTPTDGTNALRNTGVIVWLDTDIPGWLTGAGTEFLIRIVRTRASLSTPPVADKLQISADTVYSWDKDGDLSIKDATLAGTAYLLERAAAQAETALHGQVWVKDDAPNTLWFTDDVGNDIQLSGIVGSGPVSAASNLTDHSIIRGDLGAKGVQDSGILIDDSNNMSGVENLAIGPTGGIDLFTEWDVTMRNAKLAFWRSDAGSTAHIENYARDGDGTDDVLYIIYAKGIPTDISTARERMWFGWDVGRAQFEITGDIAGTGSARPLSISYIGAAGADNILIDTAGDVTIANDLTLSAGDLLIQEDADGVNSVIGKGRFGQPTSGVADSMYIGHYDNFGDATSYALRVAPSFTFLNVKTGGTVRLRVNNTGLIMSATQFFDETGSITLGRSGNRWASAWMDAADVTNDLNVGGELEGAPLILQCGWEAAFTLDVGVLDEQYLGIAVGVLMNATKGLVMEKDGSFVGYTINYDVTALGGSFSLEFVVEINGTPIYEDTISNTVANGKKSIGSQARDTSGDTFSANDVLSVKLKPPVTGGWAGTDQMTIDEVSASIRIYYDS